MNRAQRRSLERMQRSAKPFKPQREAGYHAGLLKLTAMAVSSESPLPADAVERLMAQDYSAIEAIACGKAPSDADWKRLQKSVSWVRTLVLRGNFPADEAEPLVRAAMLALSAALDHRRAGQQLRMDGPGLQAVREALALRRQALEGLSEREVSLVLIETEKRMADIDAKHLRNAAARKVASGAAA